ncbi:MAG TPA: aminotransferase class I/II-fold pyridoxal phosphate-dependent enzyme [Planctomycetaceae bacterium]|nr:aminotransferase class I/II-fold pyridoxal phosphate-dependent enzyme [Planctomycetaceae bacterium]
MTTETDWQEAARDRIRQAYDPELIRQAGHRLADRLAEHLQEVYRQRHDVLNWREPSENVAVAAEMLREGEAAIPGDANDSPRKTAAAAGFDPDRLVRRFSELVELALSRGLNLHDPRYIGHQVPASVPIAGLFDAIGSVTNQVMAVYEMGPWATAVERALVDRLGEQIGWRAGEFSGLVTHGGSLANLTGLLTARNVTLGDGWERGVGRTGPPPAFVVHADAHYSVMRAAGVLGVGTENALRVGLDERRRMDPDRLEERLRSLRRENRPIVAVVACACATPIGAFDPLEQIAEVCRRYEVWLHVDAAHGGSACFSRRYRHLVAGLDRADGVVWDAHKMLFVPALCAFVLYRDKQYRFEAFRQDAPYLFDPSAPGIADYDSGLKTIECTKRAAAFGLWGLWSLFGPQLLADMVDVTFWMGRQFYEKLKAAPDFQPLHEPECNIVAFRHVPEPLRNASPESIGQFQLSLRRDLIQSGEFYIVPIKLDGVGALRATIINPLTTPDHLDALLDALRAHGRRLVQ